MAIGYVPHDGRAVVLGNPLDVVEQFFRVAKAFLGRYEKFAYVRIDGFMVKW